MSVSSIINSATGKLFANLIPGGGGTDFTQEGQIIYGGQAPAFADQLLNIGNAGQVLSVAGGVPAWQDAGGSGLITANLPLIEEADPPPPAQPTSSKISINFSANVGEIPYGTGQAKIGTLTNASQAGQVLGVANGVPEWINAGGSGTITALAPLTEYAVANASNIAINFTAKGDLVVGGGVQVGGEPIAGVILPVGANDTVLTANSGTPSGLEWKASGSGSSPIIFKNDIDNTPLLITAPQTANDTCVIISNRTYHTYNQQIKNQPSTTGTPVDVIANPIQVFFTWTPPNDILITSFTANVYISASDQTPQALNDTATCQLCDAGATQVLLTSQIASFNIFFSGLLAINSQPNQSYQVIGGTTYTFVFQLLTVQGITPTVELIDTGGGNFSGNITVNGDEYQDIPATFTLAPPAKFRWNGNPAPLTSATCENFSSQKFVASGDLNDWVATGAINGGVAFII
jgi:hypothetical protein